VLDHPDLLRNDVELFADFNANLDQRGTVMRADAFRLRKFMGKRPIEDVWRS